MTPELQDIMNSMSDSAHDELTHHILPFWINRMPDESQGGFYGRINGRGSTVADAPRGAILNARILWSFSAAYLTLKDPLYLEIASRARDYIFHNFFDDHFGGTYWCLKSNGDPLDTKKQVYSIAFFIYALCWYHSATGDRESLDRAVSLYELIEKYSFDRRDNGYYEAFTREWGDIEDMRLSEKDENEKKTMNTHLHILEAYTSLYRIWPDSGLRDKLANRVHIFTEKIVDPETGHLRLFFDEAWNSRSSHVSYGHDIEASWLLYEAAAALGEEDSVKGTALRIATAAHDGLADDGSLYYERDDVKGHFDRDRHWWVQAEAVVGFINAWEISGDRSWLELASAAYDYIITRLADREGGEWYWSIRADGSINTDDDKAGFWKCPYHNTRMCLEIMARFYSKLAINKLQ
jgi:mannobiose 2-epimerase